MVRGVMIESFIEEGNQKPEENVYGKSITDPCSAGGRDGSVDIRLRRKVNKKAGKRHRGTEAQRNRESG